MPCGLFPIRKFLASKVSQYYRWETTLSLSLSIHTSSKISVLQLQLRWFRKLSAFSLPETHTHTHTEKQFAVHFNWSLARRRRRQPAVVIRYRYSCKDTQGVGGREREWILLPEVGWQPAELCMWCVCVWGQANAIVVESLSHFVPAKHFQNAKVVNMTQGRG